MRVLALCPYPERIAEAFARSGDTVVFSQEPITSTPEADFIVSYGYRHMIREPVLSAFKGRIINLHISILPFNRGADPNFWSWINDTPKGVTIHEMDSGLDTGPIIAQLCPPFRDSDTLASSYNHLRETIETLFSGCWPSIRRGYGTVAQTGEGSFHFSKDKNFLFNALPMKWDTPVREIQEIGRTLQRNILVRGDDLTTASAGRRAR